MRSRPTKIAALATTLVLAALLATPPAGVGAQAACATPTVNVLAESEAAVSRPALRSPSEYGLSNIYAQNSLATKPQYVYAEAGPQFAGAFEALAPAGTPPPPRAVSAYPSEDIPDDDEETWGGTSVTKVTATSAFATSSGAQPQGLGVDLGDATASSSRSFSTTIVECDTVTIIAGWTANDVVLAPGVGFEQMGETVTLVVGPEGSSADVEVTAVEAADSGPIPVEGRPADPFTDPIRENGGPTVEAGEPRTETGDGYATASGGGFNFLFTDPETGQGAGYRIGSVSATIEVLGELAPAAPPTTLAVSTTGPPTTAGAAPATLRRVGTTSAVTGTPPAPSPVAVETIETVLVSDTTTTLLQVERRNWTPLVGLLATLAVAGSAWATVAVGRRWFPTLDWIARRSTTGARRFNAVYLRW